MSISEYEMLHMTPWQMCHSTPHLLILCVFQYDPSLDMAIVAAVLFFALGVACAALTRQFGGGAMMKILVACCFSESLGYLTRIVTIEQPVLTNYIVSTLFILVTPIFIALVGCVAPPPSRQQQN